MKEYKAADIRNVAVVGHGASGKTTLVDALSFVSGSSKRRGSIKDGTTLTDHTPEEIERGYSINVSCAFAEWQGVKVNLIDTPGYLDFQGDAMAGLAAADGALCLVSASSGVEVGTEKMFAAAMASRDPVLFVVSLMDKEHADFERTYQQVKDRLTSRVIPVEIPIGAGLNFRGVINLFTRKAYIYKQGSRSGEYQETEIPDSERATFDRYYQELIEAISATDDAMLERYLEGAEIGRDEAIKGMKEAMKRADLFPLFCVSADHMIGVTALLTEIVQLMPSAYEMEELHAFKGAEGDHTVEIHALDENQFAALVFKTHSEPHIGDVSFFRVFSGRVATGQEVYNATRDGAEKLGHLSVSQGKDRIEVDALAAGDIGCVAKLRNTHTNDTLSTREHPVRLPQIHFPEPIVQFSVHASARHDEEKLQFGLHRLHDEDPTFETHYNSETHQTIISGLGERHLEVGMARLKRKYGVSAELGRPRIAYRETLTGKGEGQGRHKKQTGGRGQFGEVHIRMFPFPAGSKPEDFCTKERFPSMREFHHEPLHNFLWVDSIVGGSIPNNFLPAVEKGFKERLDRGVIAGYQIQNVGVEVFFGKHHAVDSSEAAFKTAGSMAFRNVFQQCRPGLLEPIVKLQVTVPGSKLGDINSDMSGRRGRVLGMDSAGGDLQTVTAEVPLAEVTTYARSLSSMTGGQGSFSMEFAHYDVMPGNVQQEVISKAQLHEEEEE